MNIYIFSFSNENRPSLFSVLTFFYTEKQIPTSFFNNSYLITFFDVVSVINNN